MKKLLFLTIFLLSVGLVSSQKKADKQEVKQEPQPIEVIKIITEPPAGEAPMISPQRDQVESAMKDALLIIRSSYQLRECGTGRYYGWNNGCHFGDSIYSFGVKVQCGYYTTDRSYRPWNYDKKFQMFDCKSIYIPTLSAVEYRELERFNYTLFSSDLYDYSMIHPKMVYGIENSFYFQNGLSVYDGLSLDQAWIVWLATDQQLSQQPASEVTIFAQRDALLATHGVGVLPVTPPDFPKNFLGGVCVIPVVNVGRIDMQLAGLIVQEDGKWYLSRVGKGANWHNATPMDGALTPVGSRPQVRTSASGDYSSEFYIQAGGGMSDMRYNLNKGTISSGFEGDFGFGFRHFFNRSFGFHVGLEGRLYGSSFAVKELAAEDLTVHKNPVVDDESEFVIRSSFKDLEEVQSALFLQIPLMLDWQIPVAKSTYVYLSAGGKIGLPLSVTSSQTISSATITGYDPASERVYTDEYGFGTYTNKKKDYDITYKTAFLAAFEGGVKWKISGGKNSVYTGVYVDYGLNNIYSEPAKADKYLVQYKYFPLEYTPNSLLRTGAINDVRPFAVGLRIGIGFGIGGKKAVCVPTKDKPCPPVRVMNSDGCPECNKRYR